MTEKPRRDGFRRSKHWYEKCKPSVQVAVLEATIERSVLAGNPNGFETAGFPGMFVLAADDPTVVDPCVALGRDGSLRNGKLRFRSARLEPISQAADRAGCASSARDLASRQTQIYLNREVLWLDTLDKNPAAFIAHTNLGREYILQGRVQDAIDSYQAALKIRSDLHIPHVGLAQAYVRLGHEDRALRHLEAALDRRPGFFPAHKMLAGLALRRGDATGALPHCLVLIEASPSDPLGHLLAGRALELLGRRGEANDHYKRALLISPNDARARPALQSSE